MTTSIAEAVDSLPARSQQQSMISKQVTSSGDESTSTSTTTTSRQANMLETPTIIINPLLNEFIDCIANLPNKLQLLFSELRSVDAQVNLCHRKIQLIKQEILAKTDAVSSAEMNTSEEATSRDFLIEQLLTRLHQILLQCQLLGDQKVKITGQIMELLSNKTRKLGLDTKLNEDKNFQVELNEEKILSEFKMAVKKTAPAKAGDTGSGINGRVTSRQCSSTNMSTAGGKTKQPLNSNEINKVMAKYITKNTGSQSSTSAIGSFLAYSSKRVSTTDAYSFCDEQQTNRSSNSNSNAVPDNGGIKSLRNLNNLINGNTNNNFGHKKATKTGLFSNSDNKIKNLVSSNKKPNKKPGFDSGSNQSSPLAASVKLSSFKNAKLNEDIGGVNSRPKRQLNYANTSGPVKSNADAATAVTASLNKKRRLNQLSSKPNYLNSASPHLSLNYNGDSMSNQCSSPSSSCSTSSSNQQPSNNTAATNNSKLKSGRLLNGGSKASTPSKLLIKTEKTAREVRPRKIASLSHIKTEPSVKKMRTESNAKHKCKPSQNQDDADDDLSDEDEEEERINEGSDRESNESAISENNDNEPEHANEPNENCENLASLKAPKLEENCCNSSNETESIDELETNQQQRTEEDEIVADTKSNRTESHEDEEELDEDDDNEDDEDYKGVKSYKSYNKNSSPTEHHNESDSGAANRAPKTNKSNNRIKSLLSRQVSTENTKVVSNVNEDELRYCICSEISYGQMIGCDNSQCKIEWFHFDCVKLSTKPKGKWYCPNCRGDTHKVMKRHNHTNTNSSSNRNK